MRKALFAGIIFFQLVACHSSPGNGGKDDTAKTDSLSQKKDSLRKPLPNDSGVNMVEDCSVLKKIIPGDTADPSIPHDLGHLVQCGIDSFDLSYIVPNLFPGYVFEKHAAGHNAVTYGDFLAHLNEFKATSAYQELHERVNTLDSLRAIPFDKKNIATMKPLIGRLGYTQGEWTRFEQFARSYPVPANGKITWGDMFEAFDNVSTDGQH